MKIDVLAGALCFYASLSSCKNGMPQNDVASHKEVVWTPTAKDRVWSDATNAFGFGVLKKLDAQKKGDANVLFSPFSLSTALTLVEQGATGKTRSEMEKLLQPPGFSAAQTLSSSSALARGWQGADANVQVAIANSLWLDQRFTLKPGFVQTAKTSFDASVRVLDLASPQAAPTINGWIEEKTHGKIKNMVSPDALRQAVLLVANAVYFKGKWQTPFGKSDTRDADFHLAAGKTVRVPMMSFPGVKKYLYAKTGEAAFLALPYGNGNLSMIFVLPNEKIALSQIVAQCQSARWNSWIGAMKQQDGLVKIPRFVLKDGFSANQILQQLGIKTAFSDAANFSVMTPSPVCISGVKHKAWMQVDESGTEAAASTTVGMARSAVSATREKPFQFIADRPFLAAIRDSRSGNLLFLAEVNRPS